MKSLILFCGIWASAASAAVTLNPGSIRLPDGSSIGASLDRLNKAYLDLKSIPQLQSKLQTGTLHSLVLRQRIEGAGIETTKFQHYFKGIEVVGSAALHHHASSTEISNNVAEFDLDVSPTLSPEQAVTLAQSKAGDRPVVSAPILRVLPGAKGTARLVYYVELDASAKSEGRRVILDAHSGQVVADTSTHLTLAPVHVYSTAGKSSELDISQINSVDEIPVELRRNCQVTDLESGMPLILNYRACNRVVTSGVASALADTSAKQAAANANRVLRYYMTTHGRNSFNDQGAAVQSLVHVGKKFGNAFWDSRNQLMGYGDGDGVRTTDMTRALDVAGHEMTHAVVQSTANFEHHGESGALNEAYADFFGIIIAGKNDWQLGKDVAINSASAAPIRDLANPRSRIALTPPLEDGRILRVRYPAHKDQLLPSGGECSQQNDNCWVHINSTVPGHASYLVTQAIGKAMAEKLYYTVLTQFLTETADFATAARATRAACAKLFDAVACAKVNQAFETVGY